MDTYYMFFGFLMEALQSKDTIFGMKFINDGEIFRFYMNLTFETMVMDIRCHFVQLISSTS